MAKKIVSLLLAGVMAVSMTACGSKGEEETKKQEKTEIVTEISEPIELQYWHSISNPIHLEVLEALVDEFNETVGKEKNISVVPTFNGNSADLYSNVIAAIKAGTAPDVTLALRPYVADYLQTEYVVDLAPYIADENVGMSDFDDIFEGLSDGGSNYAKEGMYSLPIHSYSEVLYYNVDFFNENKLSVPTTWEELIATSEKIHEITGAPAFGWDNLVGSFMTLVKQYGGRYTDQDGNIYFAKEDEDVALKVLNLWKDNVEAGYIPNKNPDLNWATAPVPQVSEDTAANLSAGHVITALNTTGDPERAYASYELIKFMTSKEANLAVVTAGTGYLPIRQTVVDSEEYQNYVKDGHDFLTAAVDQSDKYFYEPAFTNEITTSSAVNGAVKIMMQEVAENKVDAETALNNLKQTVGIQ